MPAVSSESATPPERALFRLFVYGTLRRGGQNHGLLEGADFFYTTRIEGYMMWSFGSYPAIVPARASQRPETSYITAELYGLDAALLARIDRLEAYHGPEHPQNLYERIRATDVSGQQAFLYVFAPGRIRQKPFRQQKKLLPGGDWLARP
ncbi:MAG: gamma-glutamylcyclotransferase family protein [Cyclonatronaceae bacterium]